MRALTPAMKEVLSLMRDGWHLGLTVTIDGRFWLQRDGLGRGGPTQDVKARTIWGLIDRGLIVAGPHAFPSTEYYLALMPKGDQDGGERV